MRVYIIAPYSKVENKNDLMKSIAKQIALITKENPTYYCMTPLFMHYVCEEDNTIGTDYNFWKSYCEDFMKVADLAIVLRYPGWEFSTGVNSELDLAEELGVPSISREVI